MKFRRIITAYLILMIAVAFSGCAKKPSSDGIVLARVSNRTVTLGELESRIAKMPSYYQKIIEKDKKRYLDDMIIEMLLYEEAARRGLERDKEVKEVIAEAKRKILIAKFVKTEIEDKLKVPDEEVKSFYESHREEFKAPALWRASHILVSNEREAKDLLDQLSKGASFEELAKAHSIDATASRGGDIGYFRVGQLVPDFEKGCLKLNVGENSGILNTQFVYNIIKLTYKKEPTIENYEKVKKIIESELKKKKRSEVFDKLIAGLKEKYSVKIEDEASKLLETK